MYKLPLALFHHKLQLIGLPGAVSLIVTEPLGAAAIAAVTNAVVANCVVFVPAPAVGAVGVPVSAGLAKLAFKLSAVVTNAVVANCVVFVPAVAVGAVGVPVSAGLASGAFKAKSAVKSYQAKFLLAYGLLSLTASGTTSTHVPAVPLGLLRPLTGVAIAISSPVCTHAASLRPYRMPSTAASSKKVSVTPLTRTNSPVVVVHISPLTGEVGAVPCGRLRPAVPVALATVFSLPVMVPPALGNIISAYCLVAMPRAAVGSPATVTSAVERVARKAFLALPPLSS